MLDRIREVFAGGELPGRAAQATMAPPGRERFPGPKGEPRRAAVLALLFLAAGDLQLLFIQRTSPPGDKHGGQISFPGGSVDPGDRDTRQTALREADEEVGLDPGEVRILGALTSLYIPVSNFHVEPYVGYTEREPDYRLQKSEVERVLTVPFRNFLAPDARRVGDRRLNSGLTLKDIPYWAVSGEEIWGATSMIVAELVALARGAAARDAG